MDWMGWVQVNVGKVSDTTESLICELNIRVA